MDRLRIPSTKRTCLIGWKRTYAKEDTATLDVNIQKLIDARSTDQQAENANQVCEQWSASFRARSPTERTRNCTQLDKGLILDIVNMVVAHLLHAGRRIPLESGATWNAGRQIEIGEVVKLIPREMLQQLRNECGGLQTLLKNHNNIFCVARGKVQFRIPGTVDKKKRKRKSGKVPLRKVKSCWFHENHPDGCPALEIDCDFQH